MRFPQQKLTPKNILHNSLITFALLAIGAGFTRLLLLLETNGQFASMIFVLVVVIIARLTDGYIYGIIASFISIFLANYFTYPYFVLNFTIAGYPLTFLVMLTVSIIVSTMTSQIKQQEQIKLLSERETIRANLLRAISHDLRTPLTSIIGSASTILENDEKLSDEQKESLLVNIRSEAQWLIRMVENLLSITRIGDDAAKIKKDIEVAEEILASVVSKFQSRFPQIKLEVTATEEPLFVPMDGTLIGQVIINLLENAVYHGRSTCIKLDAKRQEDLAVFTVHDNGDGIPEDMLQQLFSSSLRSKNQMTDNHRNMGIGLSVCYSIVKAHGGSISAYNDPNGGAVFSFTLPLKEINAGKGEEN